MSWASSVNWFDFNKCEGLGFKFSVHFLKGQHIWLVQQLKYPNLINSTYKTLGQLENYKNETIQFEQQRAINQVRQRVFQQVLQGALGTLNSCLTNEWHLRTISVNIGMLGVMKEITD